MQQVLSSCSLLYYSAERLYGLFTLLDATEPTFVACFVVVVCLGLAGLLVVLGYAALSTALPIAADVAC